VIATLRPIRGHNLLVVSASAQRGGTCGGGRYKESKHSLSAGEIIRTQGSSEITPPPTFRAGSPTDRNLGLTNKVEESMETIAQEVGGQ